MSTIDSYQASITFLSENNATHNNQFNETLTLVQSELDYNKQKLRVLTNSCGVYYEAEVEQDRNETFLFKISSDGQNVI
jgi:Mn-containing catalase